jgi:hypothetical protein
MPELNYNRESKSYICICRETRDEPEAFFALQSFVGIVFPTRISL